MQRVLIKWDLVIKYKKLARLTRAIFCKSKGTEMILKKEICFILRQITKNLRFKRVKENLGFEHQYVNLREDFLCKQRYYSKTHL